MPTWLSNTFDMTYPCDGYNFLDQTINGNIAIPREKQYVRSLLTRLTSFFGIANRMRHDGEPSFINIVKNFLFIPEDDAPRWQQVIQWAAVFTGIPFAFNFLSMIGSTLIHTVMLVTELAPLALSTYLKENKYPFFLRIIADGLHFIGRAITSPLTNLRAIEHEYQNEQKSLDLSVILFLLSLAISAVAGIVLFPLALKFIAVNLFPVAASWIGQTLMTFIQSQPILNGFVSGLSTTFATLAAQLGTSPLIVGLSSIAVVITFAYESTLILFKCNNGINPLLDKFFNNSITYDASSDPDDFDDDQLLIEVGLKLPPSEAPASQPGIRYDDAAPLSTHHARLRHHPAGGDVRPSPSPDGNSLQSVVVWW